MSRSQLLRSILGSWAWCLSALLSQTTVAAWEGSPTIEADEALPNVIFIMADDLGWSDVGFNESKLYRTPQIDRIASQGLVFSRAYSCGPNCAPSRASLMSGMYTPRHGVLTVGNSDRGKAAHRRLIPIANRQSLDTSYVTLAELFKGADYQTAFFGKWHLGEAGSAEGPLAQGFDVNVAGNHTGHPKGGYFAPYQNPQLSDGPDGEYLTDRLGDEVVNYIQANHQKRFFALVNFYSVHTPIQAKPELVRAHRASAEAKGTNAKYTAMVASLDQNVGRILDVLEELNLTENTIVVFTSDNGGLGKVTDNAPLRGSKGMLYEGGIRVPLAIRWPAQIKTPGTTNVPVTGVDFFPTFQELIASASNTSQDNPNAVDGKSLVSLLKNPDEAKDQLFQRTLYWHFPAYLQGNYPGARDPHFRTRPAGAVIQGHWKLIQYFEDGHLELYRLRTDIGESSNLANQHPDVVQELKQQLESWREITGARVPTELNPKFQD